jgi:ribosomal protein L35
MAKQKQKTHKGIKKRFRLTGTGKVKHRKCGTSHLAAHKTHKKTPARRVREGNDQKDRHRAGRVQPAAGPVREQRNSLRSSDAKTPSSGQREATQHAFSWRRNRSEHMNSPQPRWRKPSPFIYAVEAASAAVDAWWHWRNADPRGGLHFATAARNKFASCGSFASTPRPASATAFVVMHGLAKAQIA